MTTEPRTANPSVLVLMSVFNDERYLREAVESILNQTYRDFVFLIIDDGSTDRTPEILAAFRDPRLEVLRQENRGLVASLNRGAAIAFERRIPFIARMDGDDVSAPERLEAQVGLLAAEPGVAACGSNARYIDLDGTVVGSSQVPLSSPLIRAEISADLRGMIHAATTFRSDALQAVAGYREHFRHGEDFDLFVRLSERFPLRNLPAFHYDIRLDPGSYSVGNTEANSQYCLYALDCARRRAAGRPERSFDDYVAHPGFADRLRLRRERVVLRLWRKSMAGQPGFAALAALIDPRRAIARLAHMLERRLVGGGA